MFQTVFWIFARNCWVKTKVSDGALSWWRLRHGAFEILPSEPVGMSHNQFPPPQQCREWSDVDPDGRALEFVQHFQELCSFCISQRVCHRQVMCDRSWTGHVIETSLHDSSTGPGRLVESLCLRTTYPKIGTKFVAHTLFLSLIHCENHHRPRTRAPNKRVWKLSTSTQLCATCHTDSLHMVVLPSTGASRCHTCCIDGGTSLENFGYHLVTYCKTRFCALSWLITKIKRTCYLPVPCAVYAAVACQNSLSQ